ncbi:4454_t:CDS:2 [Entrophospora sp. SA101]|nr:4454_t:CDS:2 [Entrophospora sp. SA101]
MSSTSAPSSRKRNYLSASQKKELCKHAKDDHNNYEDSEDSVASELQDLMNKHYNEPLTTGDYVNYESNNETEAMPELEEIAAVVLNEEEEEEKEDVIHIKTKDALKSCEDLLIYIQQGEGFIVEEFILDGLQKLKKQLISQKFKESKQTSLDSYMQID